MGVVALPCALLAAVVSGLSQVPEAAPWATELHAALRHEPFYEAAAEGHMPKEDAERLLGGIRKASKKKSVFFVTVLDGGMLSMGENMVLSLNAAQCDTPILVVGLGGNVCSSFLEPGGPVCVEVFRESAGSEDEVAWGSHEYWAVVFRKHVVLTLVAMSKAARWAAYSDPDIVYLNCPIEYLINVATGKTETISRSFGEYDIVFSPNNMLSIESKTVDDIAETYATRGMKDILVGPEKRRADINTGLFVMRMSPMVEDLMLTTMRIFKDQEFVHGHYQQYSLVKALDELPDVRVGVAAGDRLVNGNVFWGHRELLSEEGVVSIHANWMPCQLKIPCLKEANLWVDAANPQRLTFRPARMVARMDYRYATVEACGAEAALEPPAAPQSAQPAAQAPQRPTAPGCYLWLPKGCPEHNFHAQDKWRRTEATRDRTQCTSEVKELFKAWCGTSQVETLFVAPPPENGPPEPSAPGCYVWMPSGCEKQHFHAQSAWRQTTSFTDQDSCVDRAPEKYNRWCDTKDAFAVWVPVEPEPPQKPGCYARFPTGCTRNPVAGDGGRWVRDGWGEKNAGAGVDEAACTEVRKSAIEEWCGISNAKMAFVAPAEDA